MGVVISSTSSVAAAAKSVSDENDVGEKMSALASLVNDFQSLDSTIGVEVRREFEFGFDPDSFVASNEDGRGRRVTKTSVVDRETSDVSIRNRCCCDCGPVLPEFVRLRPVAVEI